VKILGLDISTHLGVAVYNGDKEAPSRSVQHGIGFCEMVYHPGIKGSKASDPLRFSRYEKYVTSLIEILSFSGPVAHAYIEGYGYANPYTLVPLVELGTVLRSALHVRGIPWTEVAPTSLKKFLTGSGQAKKNVMLLELHKRFGISCTDDNVADAVTLALYGAVAHGCIERPNLPKARLNAVDL
jgi:Holliday junction resolvasome RuvABC endonuclease subunit